jgi:porin
MWGTRLKVSPSNSFYIEAAALQVNPIVNTNHGGTYFGFYGDTGTELPVELGLTLRNRSGEMIGNVRAGGYYDTSNVLNYANQAKSFAIPNDPSNALALTTLPIQYVRGRSGYYIQLDHLLDGSSKPDQPGTTIFLSGEYSDPNTALLTSFIDAGIVRHGTFASRPDDTIGIGFSTSNFNPRLQNLELALQGSGYTVPFNDAETAFELNYGIQAAKWLVVRPGLQYIMNPKGEQSNVPTGLFVPRNALVFGLGTYISF